MCADSDKPCHSGKRPRPRYPPHPTAARCCPATVEPAFRLPSRARRVVFSVHFRAVAGNAMRCVQQLAAAGCRRCLGMCRHAGECHGGRHKAAARKTLWAIALAMSWYPSIHCGTARGKTGPQACSSTRLRLHDQCAAARFNPVSHADEAVPEIPVGIGVEADAVVLHFDLHAIAGFKQGNGGTGGACVLADVCQRLLGKPVDGELCGSGQDNIAQAGRHLDSGCRRKILRQPRDGRPALGSEAAAAPGRR